MLDRYQKEKIFARFALIITGFSVFLLFLLIAHVAYQGIAWINIDFFTNYPSRHPHSAGIKAAIVGSFYLMILTACFSIPLGLATAIYLEEFAPKNRFTHFIELNINNLAGTPSIVFGFLGLVLFVKGMNLHRSLISGALTMSLLVLPMIIIAAREAIKGVPRNLREGAFALGVTRWQCAWGQVLPAALPGIMTGIILALSRAIGETAPMIMIGALTYVAFLPEGLRDEFSTLPIQIYNWAARPQADFQSLSAAGILVLLVLLAILNMLAFWIRMRSEKKVRL